MTGPLAQVRLDKWLWAARFFKTRSDATAAVDGGKVEVNGDRAKPAKPVRVGDEVRVREGPFEHVLVVRALAERRGSAQVAATLYQETAASAAERARVAERLRSAPPPVLYERGGRPTKKDRRALRRLFDEP